jgi:hypothetical protein
MLAGAATLGAQRGPGEVGGRPNIPAQPGDSIRPNRAMLQQQVQARIAQVTKAQLGLTDAQMEKLQQTNQKFDDKRRILVDQERDIRMALRDEMLRPDSARQGRVAELLDRVTKTQRQRVDILEAEQKELSGYLTPMQRAKYFALEQQVRQRVNQMRQQQQQGRGGRQGRGQIPGQPLQGRGRGRGVQPPQPPQ